MKPCKLGRIHGVETLGALDGPGLRTLVFFQGCHLRCAYCHNPETWDISGGKVMDADSLVNLTCRYMPYFGEEGGITLSGGEPLLQPEFAWEVLSGCKAKGIHTAIDTAGVLLTEAVIRVLEVTDLVIVDLKMPDEERYGRWTGGALATTLAFIKKADNMGCRLWIRHVVVPGLNDSEEDIEAVVNVLNATGAQIEKVELLPYHKMGLGKYKNLGLPYKLEDIPEMDATTLIKLQEKMNRLTA